MLWSTLSSLKSKFQTPPRWNKLNRIRELGITKAMGAILVAVPTLGAIKIVFETNSGITISIPLNFYLLYFSALLSLIASLIFDLRCPSVVRLNKSYQVFFKDSQLLGIEILSKHADLAEKRDAELDKIVDDLLGDKPLRGTKAQPSGLYRYTSELTKTNMLWRTGETWDNENNSHLGARRAVIALYAAAGAIGLYVAVIDAPMKVISGL